MGKGTAAGHVLLLAKASNREMAWWLLQHPQVTSPRCPSLAQEHMDHADPPEQPMTFSMDAECWEPPVAHAQLPHTHRDTSMGRIDGDEGHPSGRTLAPQIDGLSDGLCTMAKFRLRWPGAERRQP